MIMSAHVLCVCVCVFVCLCVCANLKAGLRQACQKCGCYLLSLYVLAMYMYVRWNPPNSSTDTQPTCVHISSRDAYPAAQRLARVDVVYARV